MKERVQEWLAIMRRQPPGAQMAVAGLVLLLAVLGLSEIYRALQPPPVQSVPASQATPPPASSSEIGAGATDLGATGPGASDPAVTDLGVTEPGAFDLPVTEPGTPGPAVPAPSATASSGALTAVNPSPLPQSGERSAPLSETSGRPKLVIILDDIGHSAEAGQRALDLPGAITYAILPYTPHAHWLAEEAHRRHKDVMLHAPMSNLAGMALGPGGMTLAMNEETLRQTLRDAIAAIPHVRGVNNHTGSELTTHRQPMEWVMKELQALDLFFVDSLTHSASVAGDVAREYNIPTLTRHVFLDNVAEVDAIARQFHYALDIARRDGLAVAIGHPYAATLTYLEHILPTLHDEGIELVGATQLLGSGYLPAPAP